MSDKKSKYKFKVKEKELSDDEINKYKNFKKLKANYENATQALHKTKLTDVRNKKYLLWIIILALLVYLIAFS